MSHCKHGEYTTHCPDCDYEQTYGSLRSDDLSHPAVDAPSVNDIPDAELIRRALRFSKRGRKEPRWARVGDLFALGSTYSQQLCRRFGFDPDEQVGR